MNTALARPPLIAAIARLDTNEALFHAFAKLGAFATVQILRLEGTVTSSGLRKALRLLAARHPRVTSRIVDTATGPVWRPGDTPIPLSLLTSQDVHAPELVATNALAERDPDGALLRVGWGADGDQHLICFSTHHSLADGISASRLAVDLVALLADVGEGRASVPSKVPPAQLDERIVDLPVSTGIAHRFRRLHRRISLPLPHLAFAASAPADKRQTRVIFDTLPRSLLDVLRACARQRGATMGGTLTAAMLAGIREVEGVSRPIEVSTQVSLRGQCVPPLTDDVIGCFSGRVLTRHRPSQEFWELARACTNDVKRAVRRGEPESAMAHTRGRIDDVVEVIARSLADPTTCGRACVLSISNRGVRVLPAGRGVRLTKYFSAAANDAVGASVQLSCGTLNGELHCSFIYVTPLLSESRARAIWQAVIDVLNAAIN